ncbi:MAG: ribosome small subunit-dependent GTPase A [Pirellulaceae bacterium]|nr:ribosome small subunit-dependent GTPase A [Planctomycetales bacterium]
MSKKKKKIRTDFRKNRGSRTRPRDLTRDFQADQLDLDKAATRERVSGKGELTRKRTVVGAETVEDETGLRVLPDVDETLCEPGTVLSVHGLLSVVRSDRGIDYQCATRRLLKTLSTDQRHVVATGDRVLFRPWGHEEGIIERIEPRTGVISRTSRGKQHVLVANVDQLLIIASAAEPEIKPNLIDRMLITAEKSNIRPLICINKIDLVDPARLQPLVGVYGQMGYQVLLVSAESGHGIATLRRMTMGQKSVVSGQSGVGKSSLLNAIQPGLELRVRSVSEENEKGRHTTTTATLIPLDLGGYIVDTPGIRQFQLWDVIPAEVAGFFRDLRVHINDCRFPDCTHTHEEQCAVKDAVADGHLDTRRYQSYCHLLENGE